MVDLHQNYLVFEVDATQQNELFNSGKGGRGREGEDTWAVLVFYIWELG